MGGAGAAGAVTSRSLHNNLQQTSVECSTLDTAEDMTQSAVKVSTRFRETYIIFAPHFVVEQSHSEFPLQSQGVRLANLVRELIIGIETVRDGGKPKYAINRTILDKNFHKQLILRYIGRGRP